MAEDGLDDLVGERVAELSLCAVREAVEDRPASRDARAEELLGGEKEGDRLAPPAPASGLTTSGLSGGMYSGLLMKRQPRDWASP